MLTRRMQVQLIADRLAGIEPARRIRPQRDMEEPWRSCWRVVSEAASANEAGAGAALAALKTHVQTLPDCETIVGAILAATPGNGKQKFMSLAEIAAELQPVTWLWPKWIPRGMITLLGAVPGAGKSYLALDLCNRVLLHSGWPDGTQQPDDLTPAVVYVDAESIPQVINERAKSWNLDRGRIYLMLAEPNDVIDFGREEDRNKLIEMMHTIEPALVIVDSLSSISVRGENNVDDVRSVLAFLNGIAQDFDCGLVLIHHLRKHSALPMASDLSIDDFRGSSHIIAMARSVMAMSVVQTGPEFDRNGPRKLEIVKTNLAAYPDPLGIEFVPLYPTGVMLKWTEEAPRAFEEPTKGNECKTWLLEYLEDANGPVKPKDVVAAGKELGYSKALIFQTRDGMSAEIGNTMGRKHRDNEWILRKFQGVGEGGEPEQGE